MDKSINRVTEIDDVEKLVDTNNEWLSTPELEIRLYMFNLKGYKIHSVLQDNQVSILKEFFEKINNGDDWEQSKLSSMIELIKIKYPGVPIDISSLKKSFMFLSLNHIFTEFENSDIIKSIIREGKIDDIIE